MSELWSHVHSQVALKSANVKLQSTAKEYQIVMATQAIFDKPPFETALFIWNMKLGIMHVNGALLKDTFRKLHVGTLAVAAYVEDYTSDPATVCSL